MTIEIGAHQLNSPVLLAPMSGVTDLPFRRLVAGSGAGMVVSEMVASEELVKARPDVVRRASGSGKLSPMVVQLAGREPRWMAEGAKLAQDCGADIIDINMGCPAKQVTTGLSGSALMRDLDHALTLIEATVNAVEIPVTLKMRLGWDDRSRNAPELAARAERAGVRMITVHGRTRCQFYKGTADWQAIAEVKAATRLAVIANGDIVDFASAREALDQSGANGVMIGRGAYGRPWLLAQISHFLETGQRLPAPGLADQFALVKQHYADMIDHYGLRLGLRVARKHLGWYLEAAVETAGAELAETAGQVRSRVMRAENIEDVLGGMESFYATAERKAA